MAETPFTEICKLDSSKSFAERLSTQLDGNFVVLLELGGETVYVAEKSGGEICEYCGETTSNLFVHLLNECEKVSGDDVSGEVSSKFQEEYDLDSAFEDE